LGESLTDEELKEMIEEADRGGSGDGVTFDDFAALMKKTSLF
jgi:Ca2+-binding EF-hand superfamily protein